MDPPRYRLAPPYGSRPIVVGLIVLALAGLGAIGWLAIDRRESAASPARVVATTVPGAVTSVPEPTPSIVAPAVERDPTLVDVCGLGWVEPPADATVPNPAVFAQVPGLEASGDALIAALRDSGDAFERAVALMLEMGDPAALEALAQQAVTTDDSRVYALAFRLCTHFPEQGSCARLGAGQWARVDAGNAAPWLFVLGEAATRNDRAQIDEALYRIGSATRYEDRALAPAAAIVAHAGTSPSELVAARVLAIQAIGTTAGFSAPLQQLTSACAGAALADANRRQACDAAAAALGERSDSALIGIIGASIGRSVGWPLDRIVAVRAPWLALVDQWSSDPRVDPSAGASFGCDGVRTMLDRIREIGLVGEVQAARAWIAASGKPYEAYAQIAREQEARRNAFDAMVVQRASSSPAVAASASATAER